MHFIKTNLSTIQKICLAGLLMALTIVLQKVIAVNYLAFAPFVRLSFGGPALIIFSSILLGPIYGALIGLGSDLLGYLIFDPRLYPPFLQITAIYTLLGLASYFIFSFVFALKNKKVMAIIEIASFIAIWLTISSYVIFSDEITLLFSTYTISSLSKVLVPIISFVIFVGLIIFSLFYKSKRAQLFISPLHICFASFSHCHLWVDYESLGFWLPNISCHHPLPSNHHVF
jgi:ECF transporter S component (folate family)